MKSEPVMRTNTTAVATTQERVQQQDSIQNAFGMTEKTNATPNLAMTESGVSNAMVESGKMLSMEPYEGLTNPNKNGNIKSESDFEALGSPYELSGMVSESVEGNVGDPPKKNSVDRKTVSVTAAAPKQDFSGFWGVVNYFWTGGNIDGYSYNINGEAIGLAPITGMPPDFIGGPLRKGQSALKLGQYLFNPTAFHSVKKGVLILANPKNFSHIVGSNPDLIFKGGKVWLTGTKTGGYFGKSYETEMAITDFLELF